MYIIPSTLALILVTRAIPLYICISSRPPRFTYHQPRARAPKSGASQLYIYICI